MPVGRLPVGRFAGIRDESHIKLYNKERKLQKGQGNLGSLALLTVCLAGARSQNKSRMEVIMPYYPAI